MSKSSRITTRADEHATGFDDAEERIESEGETDGSDERE